MQRYALPVIVGLGLTATMVMPAYARTTREHSSDDTNPLHAAVTIGATLVQLDAKKAQASSSVKSKPQTSASTSSTAESSSKPVPVTPALPAATATTAAATSSVAATEPSVPPSSTDGATKNVAAVQGSTDRFANESVGLNPYATRDDFTPMQTVQLLALAIALGFLGYVFANGAALDTLYAWLARTIGVKPVRGLQGQS